MKKIIFAATILLILFCSFEANAQGFKVKTTKQPGKFLIAKDKLSTIIDLSRKISGCVAPSPEDRQQLKTNECLGTPPEVKVLDSVTKAGKNYLLLHFESSSGNYGCNVCGQCGADGTDTLIWLKLNNQLKTESIKVVPFEYCMDNIELMNGNNSFVLKNGKIRIDFGKNSEKFYSSMRYDRNQVEKGLTVVKVPKKSE